MLYCSLMPQIYRITKMAPAVQDKTDKLLHTIGYNVSNALEILLLCAPYKFTIYLHTYLPKIYHHSETKTKTRYFHKY